MVSFGEVLRRHKGFGPGFDLLRLVLALSVVLVHASLIGPAAGQGALGPWQWALDFAVLPLFFALSGFLVAGSMARLALPAFLANRAVRIVPALAVEITLSALILGPLVTGVGLSAYFTDPDFRRYFLNIVGWIHYTLPGVFTDNPMPSTVNGSLWTVPHEISCYLLLAGLSLAGVLRSRGLVLAVTLVAFGAAVLVAALDAAGIAYPHHDALTYALVTRGAARLVPLFLLGLCAYLYRDRIPYSPWLCAGAALAYLALAVFGRPEWAASPLFSAVTAPLFTYLVVFAGLSHFRVPALPKGDYSYGIYLYGYPIQQTLVHLFPGFSNVYAFFLVSAALASGMAVFSWHLIERPALKLRHRFSLRTRPADAAPAEPAAVPALRAAA